jgi:hypothetical protein
MYNCDGYVQFQWLGHIKLIIWFSDTAASAKNRFHVNTRGLLWNFFILLILSQMYMLMNAITNMICQLLE